MQAVLQPYSSQIPSQDTDVRVPSGTYSRDGFPSAPLSSAASPQSVNDPVILSPRGQELSQQVSSSTEDTAPEAQQRGDDTANDTEQGGLSQEEQKIQLDLQRRDTEVRTHEQAHLSAAGQYAAGGASFTYVTGPGGKRYASGGGVPIDISKEKTPEATIAKMHTVRRAALAPANPSGADRGIAAQASSIEAQAMKEMQDAAKSVATESDSSSSDEDTASGVAAKNSSPRQEHSKNQSDPPQVSTFSRKTMASVYQNMAALAG